MDLLRSRQKKNRYQVRPGNGSLRILFLLRHYQALASGVDDPNKEEQQGQKDPYCAANDDNGVGRFHALFEAYLLSMKEKINRGI